MTEVFTTYVLIDHDKGEILEEGEWLEYLDYMDEDDQFVRVKEVYVNNISLYDATFSFEDDYDQLTLFIEDIIGWEK